jgi:hypothetical protein
LCQANGTAIIVIAVRVMVLFVQFANVTSKDLEVPNSGGALIAQRQTRKIIKNVIILIADTKNNKFRK